MERTEQTAQSPVLSAREAADILGIDKRTVYKLVKDGHLRRLEGIHDYRIPRTSLDAYMRGDAA